MPPTQSTETATWPWSGDIEQDRGPHSPPKRPFHDHSSVKRLKTSSGINNVINKRVSEDECIHKKLCKAGSQKGKITEYFKAQIKLQKKCEISVKVPKNGSIVTSNNKLVYLSGNSVPAIVSVPNVTKLPDVFQRDNPTQLLKTIDVKQLKNGDHCNVFSISKASSICQKTSENQQNALNTEAVSIFLKPQSVLKVPVSSVIDSAYFKSPKPKLDENVDKETSLPVLTSPPLDIPVIDSPSSVSSISLSVSVETTCSKPSLPSPILSAPRTIRFPVRNGWKGHSFLSDIVCRWTDCEESFSSTTALLEHLQVKHVNTQSLCETFVCHWGGCKVYDRASCSRSWLERHVLSHGGNKPFRCIVEGCGHRFSSQIMLERHVNNHFSQETSSNGGSGARKSLEATPNKLFRRNGKKLRYRRQPFSARMFDYFDVGIMEKLQHSLMKMTEARTLGSVSEDKGNTITLFSKLIARRTGQDGSKQVLLRWFPPNVINDEWVKESEVESTRKVPLTSLRKSPESVENCDRILFRRENLTRSNRRKTTTQR
uniref:C2H2-type domain-containing protein n=3 Tax=Clastoptera arizonana TaxID=38151 RepID=A0A1B6CR80_9HEMI